MAHEALDVSTKVALDVSPKHSATVSLPSRTGDGGHLLNFASVIDDADSPISKPTAEEEFMEKQEFGELPRIWLPKQDFMRAHEPAFAATHNVRPNSKTNLPVAAASPTTVTPVEREGTKETTLSETEKRNSKKRGAAKARKLVEEENERAKATDQDFLSPWNEDELRMFRSAAAMGEDNLFGKDINKSLEGSMLRITGQAQLPGAAAIPTTDKAVEGKTAKKGMSKKQRMELFWQETARRAEKELSWSSSEGDAVWD